MSTFYIKENDTSPLLQTTLYDGNNVVVDLTGALSVTFVMRDPVGAIKVNASAVVIDATNGVVRYSWVSGDTDTAAIFDAEFKVVYADSRRETFPNYGYDTVHVYKEL